MHIDLGRYRLGYNVDVSRIHHVSGCSYDEPAHTDTHSNTQYRPHSQPAHTAKSHTQQPNKTSKNSLTKDTTVFSIVIFSFPSIYIIQPFFFFFLNNPAPPEISPLPLHDALPI